MAETQDFFTDPALIQDPRSYFAQIRAASPAWREPYHGSLMVTGFDEAMDVLNRPEGTFSAVVTVLGPLPGLPFKPEGADIRAQLAAHRDGMAWSAHLASMDGETHTKHRALLAALLTYKRLQANESYLRALTDRLIDGFIGQGRCNAAVDYAHAAATYAISDLMGIPHEDRAGLVDLLGAPPSQLEGEAVHRMGPDPLIFLKAQFDGYLRARQESPGTDLMSELVQSRFKDGSAPGLETLSLLARFLFGAGQDTTSRLMGHAIRTLGDDPALQARLRAEPERIPDFLEEVLRYDAPVKTTYRLALVDTRIGDVEVPAGTIVTVCLMGGNNDPRHFPEPQTFDIDRPNVREHMAFSRGPHFCLGSPLARLEAKVAIERLLARLADIRISEAQHGPPAARRYRYEPTYTFRNLAELHIEFTPAA